MALVRLANTFWQARGWLLANSSLAVSFEIFSLGLALPSLLLLSGNTLTGLNLGHTGFACSSHTCVQDIDLQKHNNTFHYAFVFFKKDKPQDFP